MNSVSLGYPTGSVFQRASQSTSRTPSHSPPNQSTQHLPGHPIPAIQSSHPALGIGVVQHDYYNLERAVNDAISIQTNMDQQPSIPVLQVCEYQRMMII